MSDGETAGSGEQMPDELEMLKSRARMMGVEFSNNIKAETLRERIAAKLAGDKPPVEAPEAPESTEVPNALTIGAASVTLDAGAVAASTLVSPSAAPAETTVVPEKTFRQKLIEDATRLIRLRITNLDPKKKDLHGEILTVANEYIGTISKFVPFGEVTDDGYHVPYCLYEMMRDREFLDIRTLRDLRTGVPRVTTRMAREFALEILDPLTPEELERLAQAQAAAGEFDAGNGFA